MNEISTGIEFWIMGRKKTTSGLERTGGFFGKSGLFMEI